MAATKFLLSGGGTGGHIFPAVAIADELKRRNPQAEFLFVGAHNRMEMEKIPALGYSIKGLWISGIERSSLLANSKLPFKIISSLWNAYKIIKEFKPNAVIGTGGYASGPALWVAAKMGIPTFIQEQNSFPGITNKINKDNANAICVAYDGMEKFFPANKLRVTGNPVRKNLFDEMMLQKEAKIKLGFNPDLPLILSVGGSLGARTLNQFWEKNLNDITQKNIQVLWQCGKSFLNIKEFQTAHHSPENHQPKYQITTFIEDMKTAYAAADIILSRAGAIAISELCLLGKPVVLVPLPTAAEDHQTKNAEALVQKNAAIMVKDAHCGTELNPILSNLIQDHKKQTELGLQIKQLAKPEATESIVNIILSKI